MVWTEKRLRVITYILLPFGIIYEFMDAYLEWRDKLLDKIDHGN